MMIVLCRFFLCAPANSSVLVLAIKGVKRDGFVSFFTINKKYLAKTLANRMFRVVYSQTFGLL